MVKTIVGVDGMMCAMCESHINEAVRKGCSVKKVTSDHRKGVTVILSESFLDPRQVTEVILSTGYRVSSLHEAPYQKKGWFGFGR